MHEARKLRERDKHQEELNRMEHNFCPYVNGPNKYILANQERHQLRVKKQFKLPERQRKGWEQLPSVNMPRVLAVNKEDVPVFRP